MFNFLEWEYDVVLILFSMFCRFLPGLPCSDFLVIFCRLWLPPPSCLRSTQELLRYHTPFVTLRLTLTLLHTLIKLQYNALAHYIILLHYHTISNCNEVYYTPFCYTKCAGSGEFLLKVIPEWKNKAKIVPFWSIRSTEPLSSFDAFP